MSNGRQRYLIFLEGANVVRKYGYYGRRTFFSFVKIS